MATDQASTPSIVGRRPSRRAFLGGTLAAGSLVAAYGALGDPLDLVPGGETNPIARGDAKAIEKESVRISHLLRRAGFGVSAAEHQRYQAMGLEATIDELINFASINDDEAVDLSAKALSEPANRASPAVPWLVRMANTRRPLQEKMTLFWHGLLTSQLSVVREPASMLAQNEFFRMHAFDTFPSILGGISMDRAMMVYLNVDGSARGAPNENYARELMELFSLGEGNYTEEDVREAARAFTGWQVPRNRSEAGALSYGEPVFRPRQFDDGEKTFLGRTGNFRPDDVVDIIARQPAAAAYITRRLFSYFVFPNPAGTDLEPFIRVYDESGGSIGAVVEAMLRSDVFYSPRPYRSLVKSPIEYVIGAAKAVGLESALGQMANVGPRGNGGILGDMGQVPFEPPNVAGWAGGAQWLNSATFFARINFINQLTGGAAQARGDQPQQRPSAQFAVAGSLGTATQALDYYLPLTVDGNLPREGYQVLIEYAGGSEAPLTAESLRGLVYLVLGSPQFQLS
jgi:uncharacterized protein (DUF1800 family)